jgi:hypothetical protein
MRRGVIADVHGNDVALRAVLDDAARYRVDRWWVLGDLVLFGPRPAEVLDRLMTHPRYYRDVACHYAIPFAEEMNIPEGETVVEIRDRLVPFFREG